MSSAPHRLRARIAPVLLLLLIAGVLAGAPVAAAESPEAAANELLELLDQGDLAAVDGLVCEADRDAVRGLFDMGAALGIPAAAVAGSGLDVVIDDASVELLEQGDESATVRIMASLSIDLEEQRARELVREMLEAEGQTVADEDLDVMVPLISAALGQAQELSRELSLVLDDGAWLICGGFDVVDEVVDDEDEAPDVSFAGLCGYVSLADIDALAGGALAFDRSVGRAGRCTYTSSGDDPRTLTLSYVPGSLDDVRARFPGGNDVGVADRAAYQLSDQLWVELDEGLLIVALDAGDEPPADFDAAAFVIGLGELLVPAIPPEDLPDPSLG